MSFIDFFFPVWEPIKITYWIWSHLIFFDSIILSLMVVTLLKSSGQLSWRMSHRGCPAIKLCSKVNLIYSFIVWLVNQLNIQSSFLLFILNFRVCCFSSFFWPHCEAYGILVPWPGIEPRPSEVKVWSLNHWITEEFPTFHLSD